MNNHGMIKLLMDPAPTRDRSIESQEAIAKAEIEAMSDTTWQTYVKAGINICLGQMRLEESGERASSGLNYQYLIQSLVDGWNTTKGARCEHCGEILKLEFWGKKEVRRQQHLKLDDGCSLHAHFPTL